MPNGLVGKALLVANTWTQLGAAMAEDSIVNVRFANEGATVAKVWVSIGTGVATDAGNIVTPGVGVAGLCPYEDTGLSLSAGEKVFVKTDGASVTARAHAVKNN